MGNPHDDWTNQHNIRTNEGDHRHGEGDHVPSRDLNLPQYPDLDGRARPELHLYTYSEAGDRTVKKRFRARLHPFDDAALVIRVELEESDLEGGDPRKSRKGKEAKVDAADGLYVTDSGEIVIRPQRGDDGMPTLRFEFRADNPGDSLGDYRC
jgi:hypothetical protein